MSRAPGVPCHVNLSATVTREDPKGPYPDSATKPMSQGVHLLPAAYPGANLHSNSGKEKESGRGKETEYLSRLLHWTKFTKMD